MEKLKVEKGGPDDFIWVEKIFKQSKVLGNFFWMKQAIERGHGFHVIREVGFVRFHKNKEGQNVIGEIAVCESAQRGGFGKDLLDSVPLPILLKTDTDNIKSNAFYKKNGFKLMGKTSGKNKEFNWWLKCAV